MRSSPFVDVRAGDCSPPLRPEVLGLRDRHVPGLLSLDSTRLLFGSGVLGDDEKAIRSG